MRKLGKRANTYEYTVEAYSCDCLSNCDKMPDITCSCDSSNDYLTAKAKEYGGDRNGLSISIDVGLSFNNPK